jgi:hypothetical protein
MLLTSNKESVPAIMVPCPRSASDSPRFTIMYAHGNAEDISISLGLAKVRVLHPEAADQFLCV